MIEPPPGNAATPPAFLDIVAPSEGEDAAPQHANFVNVSGDGDMFALDFFYVHPAKVRRIFEGSELPAGAVRQGDTVLHKSEPVARITIPLTTATELVTELIEAIERGVPALRGVLEDFGDKLHQLSHGEPGSLTGGHDHGHEHGDDDGDHDGHGHDDDDH